LQLLLKTRFVSPNLTSPKLSYHNFPFGQAQIRAFVLMYGKIHRFSLYLLFIFFTLLLIAQIRFALQIPWVILLILSSKLLHGLIFCQVELARRESSLYLGKSLLINKLVIHQHQHQFLIVCIQPKYLIQ